MEIKFLDHGLCQLRAATCSDLEPIREHFKTVNKAKFYLEHHCPGMSVADFNYGISSIGVFKVGMLPMVLKVMKSVGIPYEIDKQILHEFLPLKSMKLDVVIHDLPNCDDFQQREYQEEAAEKLTSNGRGVIVLPTASGKSYIIAKTLWSFLRSSDDIKHCLILVPNSNLVVQFHKDLLEYGIPSDKISMFSSKNKECGNTEIIISNRQWLERHLEELPNIDVLFVDEAHSLKAKSKLSEMVHKMPTNIRMGCTATLPTGLEDKWELIGLIGPVLYKKSIISMQEDKYISDLSVTSIHVTDSWIDKDRTCLFSLKRNVKSDNIQEAYELEKTYIVEHAEKLYSQAIDHILFQTMGTNTLFLFDFIPFGKVLFDLIKKKARDEVEVFYIDGSISLDVRERIRELIEQNEDVIVIAQSTTFSTGINIKNLHSIGFVFQSKSSTKILQSIGRGLRKHKSKDHINLFDINFNFKYSDRHSKERAKIYKKEYNQPISCEVNIKV